MVWLREALEAGAAQHLGDPLLGQERQHRLAHRGAMHRVAGADAGNHAHRAGRLDLVDVDDVRALQDAQVRRLLGLGHQPAKVRLRALAQVILLDGAIA